MDHGPTSEQHFRFKFLINFTEIGDGDTFFFCFLLFFFCSLLFCWILLFARVQPGTADCHFRWKLEQKKKKNSVYCQTLICWHVDHYVNIIIIIVAAVTVARYLFCSFALRRFSFGIETNHFCFILACVNANALSFINNYFSVSILSVDAGKKAPDKNSRRQAGAHPFAHRFYAMPYLAVERNRFLVIFFVGWIGRMPKSFDIIMRIFSSSVQCTHTFAWADAWQPKMCVSRFLAVAYRSYTWTANRSCHL